MSYDIELTLPDGELAQVPRHAEGGTYVMGGRTEARLNITYNYAPYYYAHVYRGQGIRWLYGQTGAAVALSLVCAINAIRADADLEAGELARIETIRQEALAEPFHPEPPADPHDLFASLRYALHQQRLDGPTGYWSPTRENAVRPLITLLTWALLHPTATFSGD